MSKMFGSRSLLASTTFAALAVSQVAEAQEVSTEAPADEAAVSADALTATQVDDIVVTARQRSESIQDVPDAITAFSSAAIEDRGIDGMGDVVAAMPNLSMAEGQNPGTVTISVRGISQVRNGEAPVAIVIDGVQLSSSNQITQDLFDIERIEVLKGPQGALYGRNAIAGAINIITRAPTNEFEGSVNAEYANGNDIKLRGTVSGAIVEDVVLFRASVGYRETDGLIRNEFLDEKVDFQKEKNGRLRLLVTPSERLTIDLRGSYADLDAGLSYYIALPDGQPNDTSIPVHADVLGYGDRQLGDLSMKIDFELGGGVLSSTSAYSSTKEFLYEDLDWTSASILELSQDLRVEALSQEIRYTSDSASSFRYIFGAYYLETDRDLDTQLYINFGNGPAPIAPTRERNQNRAWAGFGQLAYDITPELELAVALRYDSDRRRQYDPATDIVRKHTFDSWQPKVSLSYDVTKNVLAYASYAKGFRSGGFNAPTAVFPPIFNAEGTTNYELGLKTTLLNRRLYVNGAVFTTDFRDQQVFLLDGGSGAQGVVNINKVKVTGAEADLTARPLRGLDLNAGIGFIDTDIRSFDGTGLYRGNHTPYVYRWSFNLGAQYAYRLEPGLKLTGRVDYSSKSGQYFHIDNADKQNAVNLVNVRLTGETGPVTIAAFVENLFNEKYSVEFFAREFIGTVADIRWPSVPRRYGIQAKFSF